jgi:hypothetical protein
MDIKLDKLAPALFGIEFVLLIMLFMTGLGEHYIIYCIICAVINTMVIIKLIKSWRPVFIFHILSLLIMPFGLIGFFWYLFRNVRMC